MAKHWISGCAGFLASHLTRRHLKEGHEVFGLDNLECGFMENMSDFIDHPKFHFRRGDIRDKWCCDNIHTTIDFVWHLAARGELYFCRDYTEEAIDVNIKGTLNILKQAKKLGARHFYFSDTSAEYDSFTEDEHFPTAEWMAPNTMTPMGYYAITKMAASQFVRSFGKTNNIGTTLFRYTNIYGPSMNLQRDIPPVVGSFAKRIFNGEDCIIYGDGSKRRDFLHIDDLSDLHLAALNNRQDKRDSHTFNGGSGQNFSINQVWEHVYKSCQKYYPNASGKIIYNDDQPNEARQTLVNIDKAKEHLNWVPKISFDDGVEKTVKGLWEMRDGD